MKFLGIDLGWTSGATGLCCLSWENNQLQLLDLDRRLAIEDILAWVDTHATAPEPAMIAVDAPTLIPNARGMRLADYLTHQYFGRYHAGCYPANLNSKFASRTVGFGKSLEARGFAHAPQIEPQKSDRYQIEVFPHPATVNLFGLERILKYKKGKLAERRTQLTKLRQYILDILPALEPRLDIRHSWEWGVVSGSTTYSLLSIPYSPPLSGAAIKSIEDKLDAIICAYVGAYWWYWGSDRNLVLGDRTTGYIVIPQPERSWVNGVG